MTQHPFVSELCWRATTRSGSTSGPQRLSRRCAGTWSLTPCWNPAP